MTQPPAHLLRAQRNLTALRDDLDKLQAAVTDRDAALTAARKARKEPDELAKIGTEAAVLRAVLRDQEADVKAAEAEVAAIEREIEVNRLRAEHLDALQAINQAESAMTTAFGLAVDHVLDQVARIGEARRDRAAALTRLRTLAGQLGEPVNHATQIELLPRFHSTRPLPRNLDNLPAAVAAVDHEVLQALSRVRGDMRVPDAVRRAVSEATQRIRGSA